MFDLPFDVWEQAMADLREWASGPYYLHDDGQGTSARFEDYETGTRAALSMSSTTLVYPDDGNMIECGHSMFTVVYGPRQWWATYGVNRQTGVVSRWAN